VPQAAAPLSVHWFSGSCPAGTFVQVPTVPLSAHDWQVPAQAALQQKPWAQKLEAHSVPAAQAVPMAFLPQVPPLQTLGDAQSALLVQVVLHAPVPQANGSHADVVAAWQVPVPLQVRAEVSVVPVQLGPAHCTPAP
jgi:hypothetical protein